MPSLDPLSEPARPAPNAAARELVRHRGFVEYLKPKLEMLYREQLAALVQTSLSGSSTQATVAAAKSQAYYRLLTDIFQDAGIPHSIKFDLQYQPKGTTPES